MTAASITTLRPRKRASLRLLPLDCGCHDVLGCLCREVEITDRIVDGWQVASHHLLSMGLTPVVPVEIGRALWRRGGEDRKLVSDIASRGGIPTDDTPPERPAA